MLIIAAAAHHRHEPAGASQQSSSSMVASPAPAARAARAAASGAAAAAALPSPKAKRGADAGDDGARKRQRKDDPDLRCSICLDIVAFVAKPPCDHRLCFVCAHQLVTLADAKCPQCRATIEESALAPCPATDARAAELAKATLDADGLADWQEKARDGAALHARATGAAGAALQSRAGGAAGAKQELNVAFQFSCAPTGRAFCRAAGCQQPISKGKLRIECPGGGYAHAQCYDYQRDLDLACQGRRGSSEVVINMVANVSRPLFGLNLAEKGALAKDLLREKQRLRSTGGNRPWWLTVSMGGNLWDDEVEEVEEGDATLRATDDQMNHALELYHAADVKW